MRMTGLGATCYTVDQIQAIASAAGFPADALPTISAIAMAESSGCPSAYNGGNPPGAESSYGLWQINVKGNPTLLSQLGLPNDPTQLFDPNTNARAAYRLWSTSGFVPWSVYNNGAYSAYLPDPLGGFSDPLGIATGTSTDSGMIDPTTLALSLGAALLIGWLVS